MKVVVRGRGLSVPPPIRAHVEAKLGKVTRLLPKLREARVVLAVEKSRHLVAVTLLAKQRTFHCAEATHDLLSAVDLAVDKVEHQVRRLKGRARHAKPRSSPERRISEPSEEETPLAVMSPRDGRLGLIEPA